MVFVGEGRKCFQDGVEEDLVFDAAGPVDTDFWLTAPTDDSACERVAPRESRETVLATELTGDEDELIRNAGRDSKDTRVSVTEFPAGIGVGDAPLLMDV